MRNLKMANIKPPPTYKNRSSSKNDPINTALYLSEQRAKLHDRAQPYDVIGSVAANISNTLAGPNNNPQGWRGLVSGFAQGIAQGSQLSRAFQNEERAKAYEKALDYFEAVNQQKLQQQEYQDKLENAQKQITPDALAYLQNKQKDPQTSYIMGDRMWNKYSSLTGVDGKFLGVSPIDENVFMIQNADGLKLVDIRPLFLGDQYTQNAIASLDQDYQNKLQDQRLENQKYLDLEERKVQNLESINNKRGALLDAQREKILSSQNPIASGMDLNNEMPFNEVEELPLTQFDAVTRRGFVTDARNEVTASKEAQAALRILDELEQLSKTVPNISTAWTRNAPFDLLNKEQQNAIKKYQKYQSQIAQPLIRARGSNITDAERKIISEGIPNWDQPEEARNDNIRTKKRELQNLIARGIYAGNALSRKVTPSQRGFEKFLQDNPRFIPEGVSPNFLESGDFRNESNNPAQNLSDEELQKILSL